MTTKKTNTPEKKATEKNERKNRFTWQKGDVEFVKKVYKGKVVEKFPWEK